MTNKRRTSSEQRLRIANGVPTAPDEPDRLLSVAVVYQDSLTRQWATDLWDRVGQLIGCGGVHCQAWRINELTEAVAFGQAVQAAAEADVLVISILDNGELPLLLYVWIDAWLPRRVGRPGGMVALIGLPAQPDARIGHAHPYLQAVARRGGLEFLPRENRLPAGPLAFATPPGMASPAELLPDQGSAAPSALCA